MSPATARTPGSSEGSIDRDVATTAYPMPPKCRHQAGADSSRGAGDDRDLQFGRAHSPSWVSWVTAAARVTAIRLSAGYGALTSPTTCPSGSAKWAIRWPVGHRHRLADDGAAERLDVLEGRGRIVDLDVEGDVAGAAVGRDPDAAGDVAVAPGVDHPVDAVHHLVEVPAEGAAVELRQHRRVLARHLEMNNRICHGAPWVDRCDQCSTSAGLVA